jgi:hypothetical protein
MGTGPLSEVMSAFEVFIFSSIYSHFLSVGADNTISSVMPDNRIVPSQQKPNPSVDVIIVSSASNRPKTSAPRIFN